MDSTPTPTDAMASDEQVEGWRVTTFVSRTDDRIIHSLISRLDAAEARNAALESEIAELKAEVKDHAEWAKKVADPSSPEHIPLAKKVAELTVELAALRKDVATVGESDEDCASSALALAGWATNDVALIEATKIIAAHVASRLAPVQAELETAIDYIEWILPLAKGYVAKNNVGANRSIIHGAESFLTRHQRDTKEGGGDE